jgi:L-malate glycosyltransferase
MHLKIFRGFQFKYLERVKKIYYPVDIVQRTENRLERLGLSIPENAVVFGSVARCTKKKGWEELIEVFLDANLSNAYLLLVGDGEFLPYLKDRFKEFSNVRFAGNQPDPSQYINLFDVGVSASYFWESLPTAIIEYLANGKPVICTDNAESRYIIESRNGLAGLVISVQKDAWDVIIEDNPLNKFEMKEALCKLYKDEAQRKFLASNAKDAFAKFHKEGIVKQYEELF